MANKIRTAIITGAGGGIGRELSVAMAKRGVHVVACDLKAEAAEETAARITGAGGSSTARALNVADEKAFTSLAEEIRTDRGSIDYLFNNAGIGIGGEARDFSLDDWRSVIDVNLYGVIHGISAIYPGMVAQGSGHIVNTASLDGLVPYPNHISYTASKYAVVGLSMALRIEAAPLGVKVSVVCPARVKTSIFETSRVINADREKLLKIANAAPGITPETCAKRIIAAMDRNEDIILPSAYARFSWQLERMSPRLVHDFMCYTQKYVAKMRNAD